MVHDLKIENNKDVILTSPLSLEGISSDINYKAPNILQLIFSLFKNIRPGADLTRFNVSHHPPVTALHGTDEANNIELIWCQHAVPKFYGTVIEGVTHGKRRLNLLEKGESYVMNSPSLQFRLLPKPGASWVGNIKIKCQETSLEAELYFKSASFMGIGGGNGAIKGKIFDSSKKLFKIHGQWDRSVYIKDLTDGTTKVLYNPKEVVSALPTPILRDPNKGVWQSESATVWAEVSKGNLSKEWDKAREAKRTVEEKERELMKQRKSMGEDWIPKHFDLSYTTHSGWDCSPKEKIVPPAPIIFPI